MTILKKKSPGSGQRVFFPTLRLMIQNAFHHNVGQNAAALAYYLLFALFPLLIFLSNLLGLLNLNVAQITDAAQRFLPRDIVGLIESYLEHVSNSSSSTLLWFALVFSIWFPMRAAKGLMDDVRLAYGLGKPQHPVRYWFRQLIYTVVLLTVVGLTLILSTFGKHFLSYLLSFVPGNIIHIPELLLVLWNYLRFIPISLLMLAALGTLYAAALDQHPPLRTMMPGIMTALVSWIVVSIGFSFYVEHFANYSIIYGTLGAVIVLLMWLYITAVILILGAELNAAIDTVHSEICESPESIP